MQTLRVCCVLFGGVASGALRCGATPAWPSLGNRFCGNALLFCSLFKSVSLHPNGEELNTFCPLFEEEADALHHFGCETNCDVLKRKESDYEQSI
jgi:hypothetical protein